MKKPELVPYWRTAHHRNSVRALFAGTVAPLVTGLWSALPGSIVNRLPLWAALLISAGISGLGLYGAYTKQRGLSDE